MISVFVATRGIFSGVNRITAQLAEVKVVRLQITYNVTFGITDGLCAAQGTK
jgi:hypothetical protein